MLSSRGITTRVRGGTLHRVHRGVYAVGCEPLSLEARWRAAVVACGREDACLSHFSAAAFLGMLRWEERHPEVTVEGWPAARRPTGLRVHRARTLHPDDVERHDGLRVTSAARTALDLAPIITPRGLQRIVRQALGERRVTVAQLADVLARATGHRGAGALAEVVTTGAHPTRSELEDRLLDLVLNAGLPAPQVNAELVLNGRRVVPDLHWPSRRLVVEADGASWHDNPAARKADAERQALLEAHGERVLRVTWEQAVRRPQQTLERIRAAIGG